MAQQQITTEEWQQFKDEQEFKSKVRQTLDYSLAIVIGITAELYLSWTWLFILTSTYAFVKGLILFISYMRLPDLWIPPVNSEENLNQSGLYEEKTNRNGIKVGYAFGEGFKQFLLTFIIAAFFSSVHKFILNLSFDSTLWSFIFYSLLFSDLLTFRKVWSKNYNRSF
jgi:hypothetical protein